MRVIIHKRRLINSLFALAAILLAPDARADMFPAPGDPFAGYTPQVGEVFTTRKATRVCWDAELKDCDVLGLEITFGVTGNRPDAVEVVVQFGDNFWKGWIPR